MRIKPDSLAIQSFSPYNSEYPSQERIQQIYLRLQRQQILGLCESGFTQMCRVLSILEFCL